MMIMVKGYLFVGLCIQGEMYCIIGCAEGDTYCLYCCDESGIPQLRGLIYNSVINNVEVASGSSEEEDSGTIIIKLILSQLKSFRPDKVSTGTVQYAVRFYAA